MPLLHHRLRAPAVVTVLVTGVLAASAPAHASRPVPDPGPGGGSSRLLARPYAGHAAVAALGDRLATAAATNEMSSARLGSILAGDPTAWVARDGRLYYVDTAADAAQAGVTSGTSVPISSPAAAYTLAQTFALHSRPGSQHTIYLDFNGYTLPSSSFWVTQGSMTAGTLAGWSTDSSAGFSASEDAFVQAVWRIVAEKFAAFDVDVTTQDPGTAAYDRSGGSDPTYGDHVVFTDDPRAVNQGCGGNCSGIAVVGGFDATDPSGTLEPAWVFTSMTYDKPALVAHTAAHEIGHTLGLNHDGVVGGTAYFSGHGNWFPIMGSGVNAVGQWSDGDYASANNLQDDVAVIARNAIPTMLLPDDHGDSSLTATDLGGYSSYATDGVIGSRGDMDVFKVERDCSGALTATATGIGEGQSVDLRVRVLGDLGLALASDDPASSQDGSWPHKPTGLNASATVSSTTPGNYYVSVDGVGRGSALGDGYSDYGSVGPYHLTVTGCAGAPTPPAPTLLPLTTPTALVLRTPSAPGIRRPASGRRGHPVTATARWVLPTANGGSAITGYRVRALRISASGRVLRRTLSVVLPRTARSYAMHLPAGRYRFQVVAINRFGTSPASASSAVATAR